MYEYYKNNNINNVSLNLEIFFVYKLFMLDKLVTKRLKPDVTKT